MGFKFVEGVAFRRAQCLHKLNVLLTVLPWGCLQRGREEFRI